MAAARKKTSDRAAKNGENGNRREWILEAAIQEFGEKGVAGARVDKIAERSGCNKQLIYYYFESKQNLYDAALGRLIRLSNERAIERSSGGWPRDVVEGNDGEENEELWRRFWMWEALETGGRDIRLQDRRRVVFKRFVKMIEVAQEKGEVDPKLDPELLFLALEAIQQFPRTFPQLTTLIAGVSPNSPSFEKRQRKFVNRLLEHLKPAEG